MNRKFALCVGINDYPGLDADLHGCVNDAHDWEDLLANRGYTVWKMLDAEATAGAIRTKLRELAYLAGFADRLVFTYSGHGTWLPDVTGDEADGRDEALVCHDWETGGLVTDDQLQDIFGATRYGTGALIISDSCHSGTVSRFLDFTTRIERFVPPHLLVDGLSEQRAIEMEDLPASRPRRTASLISGCSDWEYSYDAEFNGRPNGAFTAAAIDAFAADVSLNTWHKGIRQQLPNAMFPQTPQLTATPYRRYTRAL